MEDICSSVGAKTLAEGLSLKRSSRSRAVPDCSNLPSGRGALKLLTLFLLLDRGVKMLIGEGFSFSPCCRLLECAMESFPPAAGLLAALGDGSPAGAVDDDGEVLGCGGLSGCLWLMAGVLGVGGEAATNRVGDVLQR